MNEDKTKKDIVKNLRILGIDPGLCKTGWGMIHKIGHQSSWISHGVFQTKPEDTLSDRLCFLHTQVKHIIELYQPDVICLEEIFMNTNPNSTLKLGMARGVLLMLPSLFHIPVFEYRPNYVKKAVTGSGHADKEQVIKMIQLLLRPQQEMTKDSADALAIALCHTS